MGQPDLALGLDLSFLTWRMGIIYSMVGKIMSSFRALEVIGEIIITLSSVPPLCPHGRWSVILNLMSSLALSLECAVLFHISVIY